MTKQINTKWFKERLSERGVSQRKLAKMMDLDASAVTHMFHGRRNMRLEEAQHLADIMRVPVEEVLRHAGLRISGEPDEEPAFPVKQIFEVGQGVKIEVSGKLTFRVLPDD